MAKKIRVVALIIILALSLVLGLMACRKPEPSPSDPDDSNDNDTIVVETPVEDTPDLFTAEELASYNYDAINYTSSTQVGFSSKVLGMVERYKPVSEIGNEAEVFGNVNGYPRYGSTLGAVTGSDPNGTKLAARTRLVNEASYLTATGTATAGGGKYTWIDKDGYLYRGTTSAPVAALYEGNNSKTGTHRQLYKHTVAATMYGGNVSDSEQGLIKQIKYRPRSSNYGYYITGLYAPAGEVIKVEISAANMKATGGITFHIGQCLYNGKNNNIWPEKGAMNRFPMIMNTLSLTTNTTTYNKETNTYTGYIGSFVGGPIYIRNESVTFDVTISGGVAYRHFILGYTSKKEFEETSKSTAPYFDLDVWDCGVLHSGPLSYAKNYSYEDIYKAAVLWDKVASVTTTNGSAQGIVFLYDPFVAAGAAVAFPGQGSVNCPASWMREALNYNGIVTSGSWGNFHEYHHNFQNYGLGSGADGEVTNNGLNIVSYSLFTKISANRGLGSYGAQGLSGWNTYTSATWTLNRVNGGAITSTNGLAIYATLMHNFGQEAYIKSRGARGTAYLDKWANNTHHDMTYYAEMVRSYGFQSGGNYTPSQAVKNANYPLFVPVASVYQTGRSYMYDDVKRDVKTMQPFVIPYGYNYTVDLRKYDAPGGQYAGGSIVIGKGFDFKIKNVTQPENGQIVETDTPGIYTYIPDTNSDSMRSGQIRVTLEITADETTAIGAKYKDKVIKDVDLILEFEQTQNNTKMRLERTVYTYEASKMYADAEEAYSQGFAGYTSANKIDHYNPTQNANTDIWFLPKTDANVNKYPTHPEYIINENQIHVVDGKLYSQDDGRYRIYLRGRTNCALYFSLNGTDYYLGAKITKDTPTVSGGTNAQFRSDPSTYFDVQFTEGEATATVYVNSKVYDYTIPLKDGRIDNWIYIREVLIAETTSEGRSYIGVGSTKWTEEMFTMTEKRYTEDDVEINAETDADKYVNDYAYTRIVYCNRAGSEVAYARQDRGSLTVSYYKKSGSSWVESDLAEITELTRDRMIEPVVTNTSQPTYANAYRLNYRIPDNKGFTSEYFYKKKYGYSFKYSDRVDYKTKNSIVKISNNGESAYPAANLVDGNTNTSYHTANTSTTPISANNPFELIVDMGEVIKANHVTFYYYNKGSNSKNNVGMVKTFTLQGSLTGEEGSWFDITSQTDYVNSKSPSNVTFDFEAKEFRYYRLYVTATDSGRHFSMNEISFYFYNPENDVSLSSNGSNNVTLDDRNVFRFSDGDWLGTSSVESVFGHVYVGKNGSTLTFQFTGTRIGFITSTAKEFENKYDVYIDGKKINSVGEMKNGYHAVTYMSEKLSSENHFVTLICKSRVGLDSILIYNEK